MITEASHFGQPATIPLQSADQQGFRATRLLLCRTLAPRQQAGYDNNQSDTLHRLDKDISDEKMQVALPKSSGIMPTNWQSWLAFASQSVCEPGD